MTIFRDILEEAVASVPGAQGAVFADWEGEAVDEYSSQVQRTDIRILAAQWGVVLYQTVRRFEEAALGAVDEITMCFSDCWVLLRRVTDHYYVVILIDSEQGNLGKAISALDRAERKLRSEM